VLFLATVCTSLVPHHIHSFVYEVRNLETFNFSCFPSILIFFPYQYLSWVMKTRKQESYIGDDRRLVCLSPGQGGSEFQFSIPIMFDSTSLSMTQFLFCDRYNYDCIFCEFTFLTVHRWLIKDMPMYKLSCFFLVFFHSPCLRLSRLVLTTLPDPLAEFLCPKTYKTTDSVTTVSKLLTVPN